MARRQKTFSVIPELMSCLQGEDSESPSRDTKPPMTTKQAKKLYKEKNKGPKLSKAERRRQELMEQDRIRRELEKEKRLARAEAKREKKKEKEEKEKAEKRRKGLPLVAVHPSQDTLARFIRIERSPEPKPEQGHTSAAHNGDSDQAISAGEDDGRPCKRRRTSAPPRTDHHESILQKDDKATSPNPVDVRNQEHSPDPEGFDVDHPSVQGSIDQQLLDESFSVDDELFDDLDFDAVLEKGSGVHSAGSQAPPQVGIDQTEERVRTLTPSTSPQRIGANCNTPQRSSPGKRTAKPSVEKEVRSNTKQLLERPTPRRPVVPGSQRRADEDAEVQQRRRTGAGRPPLQSVSVNKVRVFPVRKSDLHDRPVAAPQQKHDHRAVPSGARAFRSPGTPMGPPPVPPRFRSPRQVTSRANDSGSAGPRFLLRDKNDRDTRHAWVQQPGVINRINRLDSRPPCIAQQLLGEDFDDFFPSPSQEIRELSEKPGHSLQSCYESVKVTALSVLKSATSPRPSTVSTHTNWDDRSAVVTNGQKKQKANCTEVHASKPFLDIPPLSTQDIFLSSQDFREFEESLDSPIAARKIPLEASATSHSPTTHHEDHEVTKSNALISTWKQPAASRSNTGSSSNEAEEACHSGGPQSTGLQPTSASLRAISDQAKSTSEKGETLLHVDIPEVIAQAPRPSPKRFFTSSGTREQELLAIERSKTTAREDARARLAAQSTDEWSWQMPPPVQDPPSPGQEDRAVTKVLAPDIHLREAEDEALLLQVLEEEERLAKASETASRQAGTATIQAAQVQAPRKANHAKAGSSPYEKMMSELAKLHTEKKDHNSMAAAGDVEYEYAGWDDDLCEALCP